MMKIVNCVKILLLDAVRVAKEKVGSNSNLISGISLVCPPFSTHFKAYDENCRSLNCITNYTRHFAF